MKNNNTEVELEYPDGDIRNSIPSQALLSFNSSDFTERPPVVNVCDVGPINFIARIKQNEETKEELSIYYSPSLDKTLLVPYTQGITLYTISVMNMNFSIKLGTLESLAKSQLEELRTQIDLEELNIDPLVDRLLKVDLLPYSWIFFIIMVELNYDAEELNKLLDELELLSNHAQVVDYIAGYSGYKYSYIDVAALYRYLSGDKDYHNSIEKVYLNLHPDFDVEDLSPTLVNKETEEVIEEVEETEEKEEQMILNTSALPKGAVISDELEETYTEVGTPSPTEALINRADALQPNVEVNIPNSNVKVTVGGTKPNLTKEEEAIKEQIENMASDMVSDIKNIASSSGGSGGGASLGLSTTAKVGLGLLGLGVLGAAAYYFKDDWSNMLGEKEFSDVGY